MIIRIFKESYHFIANLTRNFLSGYIIFRKFNKDFLQVLPGMNTLFYSIAIL
jgi:hypothetical protein